MGLYRIVPSDSLYAAICLPEETWQALAKLGHKRLAGDCPGGKEAAVKPLHRATPTSPITFTERGFIIGGKLMPNTAALPRLPKTGQSLSHLPYATYTAGLWAISDYNPGSLDSRYFGPVAESEVIYHVEPFIVFGWPHGRLHIDCHFEGAWRAAIGR